MKAQIDLLMEDKLEPMSDWDMRHLVGIVYVVTGSEGAYIGKTAGTFKERYDGAYMIGVLSTKVGDIKDVYCVSHAERFEYIKSLEDCGYNHCIESSMPMVNTQEIVRPDSRVREFNGPRCVEVRLQYMDGPEVVFSSLNEARAKTGMGGPAVAKAAKGERAWSYSGWHTSGIEYMRCRRPKSY